MSLREKLKDFMGIDEVDEDEDEEYEEEKVSTSSLIPKDKPIEIGGAKAPVVPKAEAPKPEVPKSQTFAGTKYTNQFKLVVIEPSGFDDSPRLVDSLKAKKPVIINLESLDFNVAKTIFDFLSGATYALNGNVQKVANNIFLFAPENVDVSYNVNQKASQQVANAQKNPWSK